MIFVEKNSLYKKNSPLTRSKVRRAMNLTKQILRTILSMRVGFLQERTYTKFIAMIFAILCTGGRHTITSFIYFLKEEFKDWSPFYKFFSKAKWDIDFCFDEMTKEALKCGLSKYKDRIVIAIDDFRVEKTGKTIPHTRYQKHPKSPPFHLNLMWGHRYLHATLMVCRKKKGFWQAAKAISIRIILTPHVKKPGKKATEADWEEYLKEQIENNLNQYATKLIKKLRELCDEFGYKKKEINIIVDGGYCNKTIFQNLPDRVHLTVRCRKDAKLCERSEETRKFYGKKFTPREIYEDKSIETRKNLFFYGRKLVQLKLKEKCEIYWQTGAKKRPLKVFVVFGTKYRRNKNGYENYREPMYLLTTDLKTKSNTLIQLYIYRWEIEVVHRELKNDLGISQAQVTNEVSVERCPKVVALANAMAHLAAIQLENTINYLPPPKWYKRKKRTSLEDIRRKLRAEVVENEELKKILSLDLSWRDIFERIAA